MSLDIKDTLRKVTSLVNIGNYDNGLTSYLCDALKQYTNTVYTKNGNVIAHFGNRIDGKPHILLDAHLDQVGFIVTYITDDGYIKISNVGGIDRRLLSAQEVIVHSRTDILGIVCTLPPHLKSNREEVPTIEDICIDTGYTKTQLEKIVSLGDYVTFNSEFVTLIGDRVSSPSLDDRCGIVTLLRVADILYAYDGTLNCSYSIMASGQEEVGERGAIIGTYDINPSYAIEVDVSFGLSNSENPQKCGKLGSGSMIGFAPVLDRKMSKDIIDIAKKSGVPYQIEVMNGETGTNADRMSVTRSGVRCATVSIPLRYMHTPVETIDIRDVEYSAQLIAEYLKSLE